MSSTASLPVELVQAIATAADIHSRKDIAHLTQLVRVSRAVAERVYPVLYHTVVLDTVESVYLFEQVSDAHMSLVQNLVLYPCPDLTRYTHSMVYSLEVWSIVAKLREGVLRPRNLRTTAKAVGKIPAGAVERLSMTFPFFAIGLQDDPFGELKPVRLSLDQWIGLDLPEVLPESVTHLRLRLDDFRGKDPEYVISQIPRQPSLEKILVAVGHASYDDALKYLRSLREPRICVLRLPQITVEADFDLWELDARGLETMWPDGTQGWTSS